MIQESPSIEFRKDILQLLHSEDGKGLGELLENAASKDIIHLIGHLSRSEQMKLFTLLSPEDAAEVMEEIPEAQAIGIIEDMETEDAAAILNEMESDDQADLIMELDDEDAQAILLEMNPDEAESVRKLLAYNPDTAGGVMHTEYFAFYEGQTIKWITENLRNNAEKYKYYQLKYIFVTTLDGVLKGVLQMQDLLLGQAEAPLSKIKITDVLSVDHLAPLDELIEFFNKHELFGVPVVDHDQKIVGVVLRNDILEAQTKRITQEHLESQGIIGGDELRTMPVLLRAKRRLSWLSINILLNIVAASVIALHQDVLTSVIALAVFLPIISDMSGCSGNQAVAVSMRELSIGVVTPGEVFRVLRQEISVGLLNGLVLGLLIGLAAFVWKGNIYLGLVVGSALTLNTLLAVSLGGTVPLILKGFNVDPALASGPILTTITDMVGFFLTLTFAAMALSHLGGM
ncbi:MAG: magnesium transporter MgtE [Saprospiraceae bacterium]|nr:MAG: magnesium transporter MgtE [Saprospiraceae bacterium]